MTLCTIGIGLPCTLNTQMSPIEILLKVLNKNKISPLSKAGDMLSLRTTTTGLSLLNKIEIPFHTIYAVRMTVEKFKSCNNI